MKTNPQKKECLKNGQRKIDGSNFPARRIPNNVLKRTLEIATSSEDGFWLNKNTSCAPSTNYELYSGTKRSVTSEKLRLARDCLMQRDYKNLAKILASNHFGDTLLQKASFTVFMEYAGCLQKCPKLKAKTAAKSQKEQTPPKNSTVEEKTLQSIS
ncbi:uncharacterized protein LOC108038006 [Drosophila rhopaloa]|uniref:Uncharacterized protein LOC108038006 n=1 Tax=Drosophila rhopaloa TaxID=1041015 RepID=A0A6P4DWX6_DRORH|nr:uncharacterized protein LOC108038006 [Drosophila rhopaloa]XP_044317700.1 uncharacterized protein LOC108038006 [Drosophila rhopaloa]